MHKTRIFETAIYLASILFLNACGSRDNQLEGFEGGEEADESGDEGNTDGNTGLYDVGDGVGTGGDDGGSGNGGDSIIVDCNVVDGLDGVGSVETAPPDSFEPALEWKWNSPDITSPDQFVSSLGIPLVANMTDDNGDGEIDLCDTPDIVVHSFIGDPVGFGGVAYPGGHLYLVDGATGETHFRFAEEVSGAVERALGDIDGDGYPEVLAVQVRRNDPNTSIVAFEHTGEVKWKSESVLANPGVHAQGFCIGLYDLDADGDTEITIYNKILDHEGNQLVLLQTGADPQMTVCGPAVDLDGDEDLEIVLGGKAFHHDGEIYYEVPELSTNNFSQVADIDLDGKPEIFVTTEKGHSLLEHDGTVVFLHHFIEEASDPYGFEYLRPVAIHDVAGSEKREFLTPIYDRFVVYDQDKNQLYNNLVQDWSGASGTTAFDFLGDGTAEAVYMDEQALRIYDHEGEELLTWSRAHPTLQEFPVVADVDNDGSAEILVISEGNWSGSSDADAGASLVVVKDKGDQWVPARRIWNQHAYHVTNVREDGRIPKVQIPHWTTNNTFRTQSQISIGATPIQIGLGSQTPH